MVLSDSGPRERARQIALETFRSVFGTVIVSDAISPGSKLIVPARREFETDADLARRSLLVTNFSPR